MIGMNDTRKEATDHTTCVNQQVLDSLPFNDKTDFINARKGLIAQDETVTITDNSGNIVWDLEEYKSFIDLDEPAPATVNPSLWRNAQLCMIHGLFEVADGIYQVRGYDLSNISFIKGETGWIVFDTFLSVETARAALDLVNRALGERPITAIVYSHSHVDHFGGVRGIIDEQDVINNKIQIIASEGFTEEAVSENVIAGNAMARRSIYMYGALLPRDAKGGVNSGLGPTTSRGSTSLIVPIDLISKTGEARTVDGVDMIFQFTPGSEAPTEMNTWFPGKNVLWMAENSTNTMHNILTLRGAQVRDALKWAKYLNETIDLFGDKAEVKFQSHHWPVWGNSQIIDYLKKQRDTYKYIHDQSVRLMNMGYTACEISEQIALPTVLNNTWHVRGYYGTLSHNSRAVYQRYMGWYSGNPSDLNNLPPEAAAQKYVEYMGGELEVLRNAGKDFKKGNYRWVAEVLKHVVFANPQSEVGRSMLADTYEQLGYQSESGPWRAEYLQGAYELRNGVPTEGGPTGSPDIILNMTPEMLFDFLAVRMNPNKAADEEFNFNLEFTDLEVGYTLTVGNSVLNYTTKLVANPDAVMKLPKSILDKILTGTITIEDVTADERNVHISGDVTVIGKFFRMFDTPEFWFNIVTP